MALDTNVVDERPADLALVVWPGQAAAREVAAGDVSWEIVARGPWTMSAAKAKQVRVLVAISQDVVVGAWSVVGRSVKPWIAPTGRTLHRCMFDTDADADANRLVGHPSPQRARKNPICLMQLRDLPGYPTDQPKASFGRVQVGQYVMTVFHNGTAEVQIPKDGSVVMRPAVVDTRDDDVYSLPDPSDQVSRSGDPSNIAQK